jgi:hypothetical protein
MQEVVVDQLTHLQLMVDKEREVLEAVELVLEALILQLLEQQIQAVELAQILRVARE